MANCCLITTNILICIFTFATTIIGIAVMAKNNCTAILQTPFIVVDSGILILSVLFLICSAYNNCKRFAEIGLTLMILFTVGFLVLIFYNMSIMRHGKGVYLPDRRYDEYQLSKYSKPFQKMIENSNTWNQIEKCLKRRNACKRLTRKKANNTLMEFYTKPLTPIESGCCKPSYYCNFTYVSPTNWTSTGNDSLTNSDCQTWNNDPNTFCFNCKACKAGVLQDFKHHWKMIFVPIKSLVSIGNSPF
ncbi:tetraspanin-8-like [Impatiens glandulifera]|uniref:tetraspanin-8-like n=1 Tax=Impatiens glandulifera TaxID=253017 RepID=UPI001FB1181C|nr:tetraspanin-8-like [Impatiens glandulifera]